MDSTLRSASIQQSGEELGGVEAQRLKQQMQRGEFSQLRELLARTRREPDWQDRYFMLDVVTPAIPPGPLDAACAAEPGAADLFLIQGAHLFDLQAKARGAKTADLTSKQQFAQAFQFLGASVASLRRASELDPQDPTPYVFAMRALQISSEYEQAFKEAYQKAVRLVPDFLPAHWVMVNARAKKWAGSHEESLRVARSAMAAAKPGSDMAACLFFAHLLVWQYIRLFDKDQRKADTYLRDRDINKELNAAFDKWIQPPYQARRSSVPYLHHAAVWFYKQNDRERLAQALTQTNGIFYDRAWSFAGNARQAYAAALDMATKKKGGIFGWLRS